MSNDLAPQHRAAPAAEALFTSRPPSAGPSIAVSETTLKHLEMVQVVIARMGQNAFMVKGWAVTVVAGLMAVLAGQGVRPRVALAAPIALLAFWYLDAFYLRVERMYRRLYDAIRRGEVALDPFTMDANRFKAETPLWSALFSSSTLAIHLLSLVAWAVFVVVNHLW